MLVFDYLVLVFDYLVLVKLEGNAIISINESDHTQSGTVDV